MEWQRKNGEGHNHAAGRVLTAFPGAVAGVRVAFRLIAQASASNATP